MLPKFERFWTIAKFKDGYETTPMVSRVMENVSYCFSRSFLNLQGGTCGQKIASLILIMVFPIDNSSCNSQITRK